MKSKADVIEFLEKLVWGRESIESLNEKLTEFFQQKVEVHNVSQDRIESGDDDELCDYNLMFNIEDGSDISGYFDIYMLPMRREGYDGSNMYITEVSYEFC